MHTATQDIGRHLSQTPNSNLMDLSPLLASQYICGSPSPPTQPSIESVPLSVAEGGSVLLLVQNLPEYLQSLFWYKGLIVFNKVEIARQRRAKNSSELGPAHSGREIVFSNGSLLLQNVTWKDSGFYTLRTLDIHKKMELAHIYVQVDSKLISVIIQCLVGLCHTGLSLLPCDYLLSIFYYHDGVQPLFAGHTCRREMPMA